MPYCLTSSSMMPRDDRNRYYVCGHFQTRTISRMSRAVHPRSCLSTHYTPEHYRSANQLMDQMDHAAYNWYHDVGQDLHQRDFIFMAHMQTARQMEQRVS